MGNSNSNRQLIRIARFIRNNPLLTPVTTTQDNKTPVTTIQQVGIYKIVNQTFLSL